MEKSTFQLIYERLKIRLFGYDIFISYRRSDALGYAFALKEQLSKKLICFLDYDEISVGDVLPKRISNGLKRSNVMILIGSPNAATPPLTMKTDWIDAEISEFENSKQIIVIDINDSKKLFKNQKILLNSVYSNEKLHALENSLPSEIVIDEILKKFQRKTIQDITNRVLSIVGLVFVFLVIGAVLLYIGLSNSQEQNKIKVKEQLVQKLNMVIKNAEDFNKSGFHNYTKILTDSMKRDSLVNVFLNEKDSLQIKKLIIKLDSISNSRK